MPTRHVPLPTGQTGAVPAAVVAGVQDWVTSPPVRTLVARFGGDWPDGGTGALLAALDAFSARHWDFRHGRERPDASEPVLDPETVELVLDAARALGLVEPVPPPIGRYTHLVVLGGLAHACLRRTSYAAHLLGGGTAVTGEVAALGSFRPLSAVETRMLTDAGITGCTTEVDALDAAVRAAFGVPAPAEETAEDADHPHRAWSTRTYRQPGGPPVRVLAAPSSEPTVRRAHTADTQRFWAEHVSLAPGDRVLMVTAPIYVPFQHCDALRVLALPYGCGVDTVGVDPDLPTLRPLPEPALTPGRYLQEIRSAIRSMRHLHAALSG
ncbi:hypothetical protein V6U90_18240 [Micromonospora sp. CPCC 206060]|uniref:hypothetical protein n=1 Tax=Micromonospora sp. CPCC 206060 TaxID=3122406 RepID=UPI002FF01C5D